MFVPTESRKCKAFSKKTVINPFSSRKTGKCWRLLLSFREEEIVKNATPDVLSKKEKKRHQKSFHSSCISSHKRIVNIYHHVESKQEDFLPILQIQAFQESSAITSWWSTFCALNATKFGILYDNWWTTWMTTKKLVQCRFCDFISGP